MPTPSLTRALCVTEAGPARIPLARGLRAGPWLFVSGLLPGDLGQTGLPLRISAVRVPAPLIVPSCSVQLDLWVYAP